MDENSLEKFQRFSWGEIKKHLEAKKPFEAISPMGSLLIRVLRYEPLIGLAVHAGHRVREEFLSKMMIQEDERTYEEDFAVERFIADFPIQMIGLDSRYEYDVNRPRDRSVYLKPFESWGKKVWEHPPTKDELEISYQKYDEFHELLDFLVGEIAKICGKALVIDLHSYNGRRQNNPGKNDGMPVFNLGTTLLDRKKHEKFVTFLTQECKEAQIPSIPLVVKENDVFKGDGAIAANIIKNHPDIPVVSIEIKKVYMDETNYELHPQITQSLTDFFKKLAEKCVKADR